MKYARGVVEPIFEAAEEVDASAVAYRFRGGNRIVQFGSVEILSPDTTQYETDG